MSYRQPMEQFFVITAKDGSKWLAQHYIGNWEDCFLIDQLS